MGGMKRKLNDSSILMVVFEHARKYTILYRHIGLTSISHRLMVYFRHINGLILVKMEEIRRNENVTYGKRLLESFL